MRNIYFPSDVVVDDDVRRHRTHKKEALRERIWKEKCDFKFKLKLEIAFDGFLTSECSHTPSLSLSLSFLLKCEWKGSKWKAMKGKFCNSERQCVDLTILIENFTLFFWASLSYIFFVNLSIPSRHFKKSLRIFQLTENCKKREREMGETWRLKV